MDLKSDKFFIKSANRFAASIDDVILLKFIDETLVKYVLITSPMLETFSKFEILLVSKLAIFFVNERSESAVVNEFVTVVESIPATFSEYFLILSPKLTIFFPNSSNVTLPSSQCFSGIFF